MLNKNKSLYQGDAQIHQELCITLLLDPCKIRINKTHQTSYSMYCFRHSDVRCVDKCSVNFIIESNDKQRIHSNSWHNEKVPTNKDNKTKSMYTEATPPQTSSTRNIVIGWMSSESDS